MAVSAEDELVAALARVKLIALDVDGTLTNGDIVYRGEEEQQSFSVLDGQGLVWLRRAGVAIAWITGRGCAATERRARELGVVELVMDSRDKAGDLARVQGRLSVQPAETLAMGDDLPDLGLAERAGLFAAPADAQELVRRRAAFVTHAPGGRGAVREACERVLAAKGLWDEEHGPLLERLG